MENGTELEPQGGKQSIEATEHMKKFHANTVRFTLGQGVPLTEANGGGLDGSLASLVPDGDGSHTGVGQGGGDEDTGNAGHGEASMDELGLAVVGEGLGVLAQAKGVEPEVADEGAVEVGGGRGAGAPGLAGGSGVHDDLGAGSLRTSMQNNIRLSHRFSCVSNTKCSKNQHCCNRRTTNSQPNRRTDSQRHIAHPIVSLKTKLP